jgi:LuxR family maltose regulon positive regulatory protein
MLPTDKIITMSELPTGTVTFLFTDIEGSTPLWERNPQAMRDALSRHNAILQTAIQQHEGHVFQVVGDAFHAAFSIPIQALEAALAAQRTLAKEPWGEIGPLRVRMGIHTGLAEVQAGEYLSNHTLNRVARLTSAGHGGQVLISAAVAELVREHLPEDVDLEDLGEHRLKGLSQSEHMYQVVVSDLPSGFPPLLTQTEAGPSDHKRPDIDELLSTKFTAPYLRSSLVTREPLLRQLDEGLEHKLTLVSAPAGFGKTTLVSEWIASHGEQRNLSPVAWVSLDPDDNDPVRFWRYVLTACQAFENVVSKSALAILDNSPQPPFEALLTMFINQLALRSSRAILVLDDYHVITAQEIHQTMTFVIENLPPTLHIILITRSNPPLPLARMQARNELNALRAEDLRFSLEEAKIFIQQAISTPLSIEVFKRLVDRTEGWIAGLHLATLALQRRENQKEIELFLDTFTGSLRPIQEYLVEEVFAAQPEYLQNFLLRTSILSRLTGSLCDEVTGRDDSSIILDQLERDNLFLMPLDASGQWHRFHALFSEAMQQYARQRFGEAQLHELHGKASLWYENHGLLPEAVEAALASLDYWRTAGLIQRIIEPRITVNEHYTLRRWIEQIPEEILRNYPNICMTGAVAILFTSDRHAPATQAHLELPLQIAEEHWQREGNKHKLGEVLAFRSLVAWLQRDIRGSFSLAREALALLPDSEIQWRGVSLLFVGAEDLYAGKLNKARQMLTEAQAVLEAAENIFGILDTSLLLAEVYFQQGELRQAAHLYRQVIARTVNAPMDRDEALIRRGRALFGLSTVALEGNDLKTAEQHLTEGMTISQQFPDQDVLAHGPLVLARIRHARGETKQAQDLLGALVVHAKFPLLLREARAYQARMSIAMGGLSSVERWSSRKVHPDDDFLVLYQEQEALVLARLLIAQKKGEEALHLLHDWLVDAQANGRVRSEMEIKILMALAHAAVNNLPRAKQALVEALTLAQPEGYRGLFMDEGGPLTALLGEVLPDLKEDFLANFVRALLYAQAQETFRENLPPSGSMPSIEPLSEQELRVLRLLGTGLTNPEIAQELVVSLNTVKTHVKSIYRKLNVRGRSEARQVARHLNLV